MIQSPCLSYFQIYGNLYDICIWWECKHKKGGKLIKKLLTTLFITICALTTTQAQKPFNAARYNTFAEKFKHRSFNPENFKDALKESGLPAQHINEIFRHAQIESGNFRSKIFKNQNNAFGMRLAKRRKTLANDRKRGYAVYDKWYDSVYDYWLWYEKKPIQSHSSWGSYLRSRNYMNPGDRKR